VSSQESPTAIYNSRRAAGQTKGETRTRDPSEFVVHSGSRGDFSPGPHTTRHAAPQRAVRVSSTWSCDHRHEFIQFDRCRRRYGGGFVGRLWTGVGALAPLRAARAEAAFSCMRFASSAHAGLTM
jgi:hypothetical protein